MFIKIVLLCSLCYFNNIHNEEHHVIDISDKESLEENDISYNKSLSEFDEIFKQVNDLKENLEEEIEKINKSRDVTMEQIKNIYEEKHLRLNEEESKLKSELDLKVTEIKDDLEKYLTDSNDMLSCFERINKALKNYEKKNNNNDIKTLCFISEIQKVNDEAQDILEKPIKNVDIKYNTLFLSLEYKDYYFNGIPTPKDINVWKKDEQVYITWDIDDIRIKNYDKEKIQYLILISKGKNKITYKTLEKSLLLDKDECKNKIEYLVKICTFKDDSYSDWSEIKKFKVDNLLNYKNNFLFGNYYEEKKNPFI